jgi:hypothetical protein
MVKQTGMNFFAMRVLQNTQILRADSSQEQNKDFLFLKSFISYFLQSIIAVCIGWLLPRIVAEWGFTPRQGLKVDEDAPLLLQGDGLYINSLIILTIILCQFVYLVLRVRLDKELKFAIGWNFLVLLALVLLCIFLVLDYYSKVQNPQTFSLYVTSSRDFALLWIGVGTFTLLGYERNNINTRERDYELDLGIATSTVDFLVENGDRLDLVRPVEFVLQLRSSKVKKAFSQLKDRGYEVLIQDKLIFNVRVLAIKNLRLSEVVGEIEPLYDIALSNKGCYLGFSAEQPNAEQ